ncbi:MAG: mycofactocin precursor MftA [Halobacteriales archaeon]|jgi:mycofactocin precursor
MSQRVADTNEPDQKYDTPEADADAESDGEPEIEEDLLQEELRIDGICGVY